MTNRFYFRNEQEPNASRSGNIGEPTEPQQFEPSLSHQSVVEIYQDWRQIRKFKESSIDPEAAEILLKTSFLTIFVISSFSFSVLFQKCQ